MNEPAYQEQIRALSQAMREKACELADYLVTQPDRRAAVHAVVDFGWWCLGQGAKHANDVSERLHRRTMQSTQARHGAGATFEE